MLKLSWDYRTLRLGIVKASAVGCWIGRSPNSAESRTQISGYRVPPSHEQRLPQAY